MREGEQTSRIPIQASPDNLPILDTREPRDAFFVLRPLQVPTPEEAGHQQMFPEGEAGPQEEGRGLDPRESRSEAVQDAKEQRDGGTRQEGQSSQGRTRG